MNISTFAQQDQSDILKQNQQFNVNIFKNKQSNQNVNHKDQTPFQRLKRNSITTNKIDLLALSEGSNESSKSQTSKNNFSVVIQGQKIQRKKKKTNQLQRKSILNTIFAPFTQGFHFTEEKKQNPYSQFTIDDLKTIENAIETNKQQLEKELNEIHKEKTLKKKITIKPQIAQRWDKAKNNLMAISYMRKLFGDIKMYGTSMSALNVSEQVINKCRELLENKDQKSSQISNAYLFYKESDFLFYWNLVLMILFIYTSFFTPIKIFFYSSYEESDHYIIDKCVDFILFLDILVICNTAVIQDNLLIENRKKIFLIYLKNMLFLDLLSVIPFEIISTFDQSIDTFFPIIPTYYNDIIKLIKLPRTYNRFKLGAKLLDALKINTAIFRLIKFITIVIICIHIMGCLWYFIGIQNFQDKITWIEDYNISNQGLISRDPMYLYTLSIYWCIETGATVGFGDVHAYNEIERIVSIIWMILGAGAYSFTIGSLSNMLIEQDTRQSKLTKYLCIADEFCSEAKLSKELKNKIKKALQYNAVKSILSEDEKEEFFEAIPMHLKFELATNMFHGMIEQVPFLQDKPTSFIAELMPALIPVKMLKGEIVYYKGSYPNMIYFITNGRVNFVFGMKSITFKSFVQGSYFGEIEIIHSSQRLFTVRCEENSEFLTLERDYFQQISIKYPQIFEDIKVLSEEREILMSQALEKVQQLGDLDFNDDFWDKPTQSFQQIINEKRNNDNKQINNIESKQNALLNFSLKQENNKNNINNKLNIDYRRKSYRIKSLMIFGDHQSNSDQKQINSIQNNSNIKIEKYEKKQNSTLTMENIKKLSENNLSISVFDEHNQLKMLQVYEEEKNDEIKEKKDEIKEGKDEKQSNQIIIEQTTKTQLPPIQSLNSNLSNPNQRRKTTFIQQNLNQQQKQQNQCIERPDCQEYVSQRKQSCILQQFRLENQEQQKQSEVRKQKNKKQTLMVQLKSKQDQENQKKRRKSAQLNENNKDIKDNDDQLIKKQSNQKNKSRKRTVKIKDQNQSDQQQTAKKDDENIKIENFIDLQQSEEKKQENNSLLNDNNNNINTNLNDSQNIQHQMSNDSRQSLNEQFKFIDLGTLPIDDKNKNKSSDNSDITVNSNKNKKNSKQIQQLFIEIKSIDKKLDNLQTKFDSLCEGFQSINIELNKFLTNQKKKDTEQQKIKADKFGLALSKPSNKLPKQELPQQNEIDYYIFNDVDNNQQN